MNSEQATKTTLPRPAPGRPIHPDAVIPCPMRTFNARKATACTACAHFRGLLRISEDAAGLPFDQTFRVQCAHPIARRVQLISE